ncbi:MAG: hypothetical protein OXC30_06190, partial [Alphaproteobacteria bacterium]|nr:hypothetical protein [Alphaproteobacteria bacterium]
AHLRDPLDECKNDSASVVEATCCIPNIESDSTTSHSEPKQSLHGAAKTRKTKRARREFRDREHRAIETILRSENNLEAILRNQIEIRRHRRRRCPVGTEKRQQWETEIDAVKKMLNNIDRQTTVQRKEAMKARRKEIQAMLRYPQSRVACDQEVALEENHELRDGEMPKKRAQPPFQDIDELRKLEQRWLRDNARLKDKDQKVEKGNESDVEAVSSEDQGTMIAMEISDDEEEEYVPLFETSVSGCATSGDTGCGDSCTNRVLQMLINSFLDSGKNRAANQRKLIERLDDIETKSAIGETLSEDVQKERVKIHAILKSYHRTRMRFLLSLVDVQKVTLENIASVTQIRKQSMKSKEEAEASEAHYLLKVHDQIDQGTASSDTIVKVLARREHERKKHASARKQDRERKRTPADAGALDEESTTSQNKRLMTPPSPPDPVK